MVASLIYYLYEQFFKNYSPNFLQRLLYKFQKVLNLLTITSVRRVAASNGAASDSVSLICVLQLGQMMVGSVMGVCRLGACSGTLASLCACLHQCRDTFIKIDCFILTVTDDY
ncbi:MAG: hypothetical protein FD135_3364 [Comamonadaceae bacterium]|nr:MAG: hypothetical protein FD135_3364 [Comamonadaceae bacterium]